jgi:hypothetical protein
LTSIPNERAALVPKMVLAWAVRKASTTPDPGPTSRMSGASAAVAGFLLDVQHGGGDGVDDVGEAKRAERKLVSDGEDSVSRSRNESSDGS